MPEDTSERRGDALPGGSILGAYTIERVLGQGGFGITYLALDAAAPKVKELQGVIGGMQGTFMPLMGNQYYGSEKLKQALDPLRGDPEE